MWKAVYWRDMKRGGGQYTLFETEARLGNGFRYRPDFITPDEEELLIAFIQGLPPARGAGGEYEAARRFHHFGWGWDFRRKQFKPGPPLPPFLGRFARRIEKWLDLPRGRVVEALVNEYPVGGALGWHRDNEQFEHIVGISLSGWVRMRLRPYQTRGAYDAKKVVGVELEPRSAYIMQGDVRWKWQHSIAAARTLRYSITFRTLPPSFKTPRRAARR